MNNRTFVCFRCKIAVRFHVKYGSPNGRKCRKCTKSLRELPRDWRILKRNDDKSWKEMHSAYRCREGWLKPLMIKNMREEIKRIQKKVAHLENRKELTVFQEGSIKYSKKQIQQLQDDIISLKNRTV